MNANNNNHTNGTKNSELSFDEAPASWNTRYLDPNGFECQITLRGENGSELLEKAATAITYLLANACTPSIYYRNGTRPADSKASEQKKSEGVNNGHGNDELASSPSWCPIHQCEMKRWDKDGRVWYSHKFDGEWCRGK
jgi:hypothetical protein